MHELRHSDRVMAGAGIAGVAGFVTAWAVRGAQRPGYSPVSDAISRLAEVGSPGRNWMTAGFVAYGTGVPIYALALRRGLEGPAWIAVMASGLSTLGVAAAPLGRFDRAHVVFATIGYVSLAGAPLLASRAFATQGATAWARWSFGLGVMSAAVLSLSAIDAGHGLSQRVGLGAADLWIIATAWSMVTRGDVQQRHLPPD